MLTEMNIEQILQRILKYQITPLYLIIEKFFLLKDTCIYCYLPRTQSNFGYHI